MLVHRESPFVCVVAHESGLSTMDDCLKRQTATATPAKPGGFPRGLIRLPRSLEPAAAGLGAWLQRLARCRSMPRRHDAGCRPTRPNAARPARVDRTGPPAWPHPTAGRSPARAAQQWQGPAGGRQESSDRPDRLPRPATRGQCLRVRSEEHTSELQSRQYLVCRLLLDKKTTTIVDALVVPRKLNQSMRSRSRSHSTMYTPGLSEAHRRARTTALADAGTTWT